ncbi:NAD(+) diphosphatase [Pinisolibacter sp.]|uniref:NAD(+) diphosphatase n=1 Tax=Pinisolibacter sp. TaxID=2172024 RepID=UPI002FDD183E
MSTFEADEPSVAFRFARNGLDRRADLRDDRAAMDRLLAAAAARFLVVAGDRPLVRRDPTPTAFHDRATAAGLGARFDRAVFLGLAASDDGGDRPWFALRSDLDETEISGLGGIEAADLRTLAITGTLAAEEYGAIAQGRACLHWHATHRFCARCGAPSEMASAGWKRVCPSCGAEHFPRTDPVVIMLVSDGERCLLGRQSRFPPGMWSCLAGFMEPGETIEAAVRRETFEEAGICVGRVSYFASEPWPFPASLMIGAIGRAASVEIRRDENELEDCRWFSREEAARLLAGDHPDGLFAPPPIAIAHHLLVAFVAGGAAK